LSKILISDLYYKFDLFVEEIFFLKGQQLVHQFDSDQITIKYFMVERFLFTTRLTIAKFFLVKLVSQN